MEILILAIAAAIVLVLSHPASAESVPPFFGNLFSGSVPPSSSSGGGGVLSFNSPLSQIHAKAAQVASEFGIPPSIFLALIEQESGFNPRAGSVQGAYGLTQLMPETAAAVGVGNSIYHSPDNQLYGGAKYLAQQYAATGDWAAALMNYHGGPSGYLHPYAADALGSTNQAYADAILRGAQNYTQFGGPP